MRFLRVSSNEAYFRALEVIGESSRPIGAWRLCSLLKKKGLEVSRATAGRILKTLEDNGHARIEGRVGRVITLQGQEALQEWLHEQVNRESHMPWQRALQYGQEASRRCSDCRRAIEKRNRLLGSPERD